MNMNKLFAGLIAFVAAVVLSAGSAFATRGYTIGDSAGMKLIPFYQIGGTLFTAIAIHNMSMQEQSTIDLNAAVDTAQDNLDDADRDELTGTAYAALEEALTDAQDAAYTEHLFVNVMVYDGMGMSMMDAPAELCLAENQGGHVLLTEPDVPSQMIENRGVVISMDMDMIPAYGYVTVMADTKYTDCMGTRQDGLTEVDTADSVGSNMVAAWTILQDVGTGFFGTEIPTATITMMADDATTDDVDESTMLNCYTDDVFNGRDDDDGGPYQCGLIPERHENSRNNDGDLETPATPASHVTVRFDVIEGTENDVFVWLAEGMDTEETGKRERRMLSVTTRCEDGTMAMIPDPDPLADDGAMLDMAMVPAPGMVTHVDPMGEMLMPYTSQCMAGGGRGILQFMMPNKSVAGMAWSHISQRMANFRMNMAGYNMASPTALDNDGLAAANE